MRLRASADDPVDAPSAGVGALLIDGLHPIRSWRVGVILADRHRSRRMRSMTDRARGRARTRAQFLMRSTGRLLRFRPIMMTTAAPSRRAAAGDGMGDGGERPALGIAIVGG
jgi:hypothetical protein